MAWSELGPAHVGEIMTLIGAIETADGSLLRTSAEEVEGFFDPALKWRAIGMFGTDGSLLAFGLARMAPSDGEVRLYGGVHPHARGEGIGRLLASQQLKAAREIGGKSAVVHVDHRNLELAKLLEREGFELSHSYVQLRRSLDMDDEDIPNPAYIRLTPLTANYDADVVRRHNAIQVQAGGAPMAREVWTAEHAFIDRDWSFVALDVRGDRPRVAAYIVCERYEQDWHALGWSEGYIAEVALGDEWRGLRLISLLLGCSMDAFRKSGVAYAGIDISEDNYLLSTFEDYGFETIGRARVYIADVGK
ncbi:MAG: GNAT family N-acetyltransferase [Actinomycetaceae bacterium]|nr:GNAT family N-acetyltransferase [Actinomycetaceae bacterium]